MKHSILNSLKATCLGTATFALLAASPLANAGESLVTIDYSKRGPEVNPHMYGVFFEEISHAGQGGLHADMVRNGNMESSCVPGGCNIVDGHVVGWGGWSHEWEFFDSSPLPAWSLYKSKGSKATMSLDNATPLNQTSPHSLRLDVESLESAQVGVVNEGFWGMPVRKNARYQLTFYARCKPGFQGDLLASLEGAKGKTLATSHISKLTEQWKPFRCILLANASEPSAKLVLSVSTPGTVWLDAVTLFPAETLERQRFHGLRTDIAEMVAALKPGFLRFPGGSFVEGASHETAYRWKNTIGDPASRQDGWSMWGYHVDHGFGYHEMLQFAEDMGCPSLYVAYCGTSCPWWNGGQKQTGRELELLVQEAVDAVEYARGPITSKYGAMRAGNGHPKPFDLRYVEIGNEASTAEIFTAFQKAIKEKYPDVVVISAAGTPGLDRARPELVDDHLYPTLQQIKPEGFFQMTTRYDNYSRTAPRIYVGEYAQILNHVDCPPPGRNTPFNNGHGHLYSALAEASFMLGMERNADVVSMASYAPLLCNVNDLDWAPDMIYFDNHRVYGQPSYYVQQMFSLNRPDVVLPTQLRTDTRDLYVLAGLQKSDGQIILKIINAESTSHKLKMTIENASQVDPMADLILLTSVNPEDTNSFEEPTKVSPRKSKIKVGLTFSYEAPPYSFAIIRLRAIAALPLTPKGP